MVGTKGKNPDRNCRWFQLKVNKSQKQNYQKKLLPKMNGRICFSILIVRNYLKLEISISSFKYFRTVKQKNQIRLFGCWENLRRANLLTVVSNLYNRKETNGKKFHQKDIFIVGSLADKNSNSLSFSTLPFLL